MTDLAQILAVATSIASAVAGAAALVWRTQRADVAALREDLASAAAKRDAYHAEAVERLEAQVAAAREDAAKLTAALTASTDALRENSALLRDLEDARDDRASVVPQPLRKGGR